MTGEKVKVGINKESGFTLIDLLAVMFIIAAATVAWVWARGRYGFGGALAASVVAGALVFALVRVGYWAMWRRSEKERVSRRAKYAHVYRVLEVPKDPKRVKMAAGATMRVGDVGWEAEGPAEEGLIYLQGLTAQWNVVWFAGFRLEQIEKVSAKPMSQYDWNWTWINKPPVCPFPIARETPDMGWPLQRF